MDGKNMPRLSRYNHFLRWGDKGYLAYSAMSGAVALMTEENYAVYLKLADKLKDDPEPALDEPEQELLKQMLYGEYAYEAQQSEPDTLRFRHNLDRYSIGAMGLIIAPTMACNMACTYCFENNNAGKMKPEVVDAVVSFVSERASTLGGLSVSWYGGEPLLAVDVMGDLTDRFVELANEKSFQYSASIITNGYLLTSDMVDRLVGMKVNSAQVTVDGPARVHNRRRPLKNKKPSFDTIIENIGRAASRMNVSIRVNVDRSSDPETISELLGELRKSGLAGRVRVHFGRVEPATTVCSNIAEVCYETQEYSQAEIEYYGLLLEYGFTIDKLPSPTSASCMAQLVNSFLVDPDGDMYRCFNHVGNKEHATGNVTEQLDYRRENFTRLFAFDPFGDQMCSECNLLPICMGGCPSHRADRNLEGTECCPSWKHNLEPMLELIARSRQQQMTQNQAAEAAKE